MHSCKVKLKRQLQAVGLSLTSHWNSAASGHLQPGHPQAVQSPFQVISAYSLQYFTISTQTKGSSKLSKLIQNEVTMHILSPKHRTKGCVWFPISEWLWSRTWCLVASISHEVPGWTPGHMWGYLPRAVQVLSPNHPMILLCIVLVTFSSVTHLSALGRGWHVADFMDEVLHVLGSALMCCNSLCSH